MKVEVIKKWDAKQMKFWYHVFKDGNQIDFFAKEQIATEYATKLFNTKDQPPEDEVVLILE